MLHDEVTLLGVGSLSLHDKLHREHPGRRFPSDTRLVSRTVC